jgi:hypothetical protein
LTESEQQFLENLKTKLKFDSIVDLLLYCSEAIDYLRKWDDEGYKFIRMKDQTDAKEVSFEFNPQSIK